MQIEARSGVIAGRACRLLLALAIAACGSAAKVEPTTYDCIDNLGAGIHRLVCPGTSAPLFVVSVPAECLTRSCGLIVDVHGGGMTADDQNTHTHLRELGEQHGYIVVQPDAGGPGVTWDRGGGDDDRILAFMRQVIAAWRVDPRRVHMTGHSAGGYMTWRFLCRHADLLASVAPAAAAHNAQYNQLGERLVGCSFVDGDRPSEELDVLYMHGKRDECIRFESASAEPDSALDQRQAVVDAWGLGGEEPIATGADHERFRYRNAAGTTLEVLWHSHEKATQDACPSAWRPEGLMGHCIPGGAPAIAGCVGASSFAWGEEAIRFFEAHPRER